MWKDKAEEPHPLLPTGLLLIYLRFDSYTIDNINSIKF